MNEAEKKLEAYRNRKRREAFINNCKTEVTNMFAKFLKKGQNSRDNEAEIEASQTLLESSDQSISPSNDVLDPEESSGLTLLDYIWYCLWFVLWTTLYAIFIKLEFGTVYLIISGLVGMFLNTRTRPKLQNEVSAYSVFNKNCESIDGTLDAEKLTKEMVYGGFAR